MTTMMMMVRVFITRNTQKAYSEESNFLKTKQNIFFKSVGVVVGPVLHAWYGVLFRLFPAGGTGALLTLL
jgi:hypothetical protein